MADDVSATFAGPPRSSVTLSASVSVLAALNLLSTFGFQWLPVHQLGVGRATDALFFSAVVPQIVLSVVASGLTSVLTPLLSTATESEFRHRVWTFAHGVAAGAVVINSLLLLAAPVVVSLLAPGFDAQTRAIAVDLVRIQVIAAVFTALLTVSWSAYYATDRFIWVEASGLSANVVGLLVAWIAIRTYGVYGVAWAMVLRAALQVTLLLPGLGAYNRPDWRDGSGRMIWRRLLPIVGGSIY